MCKRKQYDLGASTVNNSREQYVDTHLREVYVLCARKAFTSQYLNGHMLTNCSEMLHKCEVCMLYFSQADRLKTHIVWTLEVA